ncbi:MAG: DUF3311 domain-containing protein [Verrucomicrobiota bacterium]
MKKLIYILVLLMVVLHQDVWNWDKATLVFGFIPVGLAYHAGYSIAAACLWAFAIKVAWPTELEAWADDEETEGGA